MPDSDPDKGFEVKDRRRAKEALSGSDVPEPEKPRDERPAQPEEKGAGAAGSGEAEGREHGSTSGPPTIDFISFVGSLAATAYFSLGEKLSPDQQETVVDLPAAKQMIDLLDLIKAKTRGNLDKEESEALDAILYNLRMRFVHVSSKKGGPAA